MKQKYAILLCIAMLCSALNSFSSHLMGGNITYSFVGFNSGNSTYSYAITLKIYRYCNSMTQLDNQVNLGAYFHNPAQPNAAKVLATSTIMPLISQQFITPPSSNPNCTFNANVCVEEGVYADTIQLSASTGGYHLMVDRCCRNANIANLNNPGNAGETYYAFIPPTSFQNNSPTFATAPVPYLCAADTISVLNSAFDPDGDSLVYSFEVPYNGPSSPGTPAPAPPAVYTWPITAVTYATNY